MTCEIRRSPDGQKWNPLGSWSMEMRDDGFHDALRPDAERYKAALRKIAVQRCTCYSEVDFSCPSCLAKRLRLALWVWRFHGRRAGSI